MRTRANYGIVGPTITTNMSTGRGVFSADDQRVLKNSGLWAGSPGFPLITSISPSGTSATVYFSPPVNNGGASISSYTVTANPGNITASGSSSPITVTVSPLTQYSFTITATNSFGTGAPGVATIATTLSAIIPVQYLVVAGGGSGSGQFSFAGGGGGGGGYRSSILGELTGGGGTLESALPLSRGTQYTVTVGAGGAAGTVVFQSAAAGSNSVFASITSLGGGASGYYNAGLVAPGTGGSGGGAVSGNGGSGTAGQGYAGGFCTAGQGAAGAGGGGAGGIGGDGVETNPAAGGAGGLGISSSVTGTSVSRGGGGGGGLYGGTNTGPGTGNGGGGSGNPATSSPYNGNPGTVNTGGGGGGGSWYLSPGAGGNGGSGIVSISVSVTEPIATSTGSPIVTTGNGFRVYTFNSSGTITF